MLNLLYPQNITCIICNRPIPTSNSYSICKSCFNKLNFIKSGCPKCGKFVRNYTLEREFLHDCSYCYNKKFYFDRAISCLEYNETSKKLIFGLKYNKKTFISKYISQIIKEKLELENLKYDYILFVPLNKKRLRKRGFNQSFKISKYLGEYTGKKVIDCLNRRKNTRFLFKLKKQERRKELTNAFEVNHNINILKNKKLLLIDDIFTTGATTNEISKLLKLNSIDKVYVMTLLTRSSNLYIDENK